MLIVFPIPIYQDNYIWVIQQDNDCLIIDPGRAEPVLQALRLRGLTPKAILITHKHWDHIAGINAIKQAYSLPVYGPSCLGIAQITHPVSQGSLIHFHKYAINVLEFPGHTAEHLAYYVKDENKLFSGDTIFSAGCGRLFDGTIEQLFQTFCNIQRLPDITEIYGTHEYTLSNLKFAMTVEPKNLHIQRHFLKTQSLIAAGNPTLPTRLGLEKAINPFLRTHIPAVRRSAAEFANTSLSTEFDVFRALRLWKNSF